MKDKTKQFSIMTNQDGSPKEVYCPAYQDMWAVSDWKEYYYYSVFDGLNHDEAKGVASLKAWKHEPESQI